MDPTHFPTQGQPNPRTTRLKVAFGPLFPTAKYFFVGWDWLYIENGLQETQRDQIIRKHPNNRGHHLREDAIHRGDATPILQVACFLLWCCRTAPYQQHKTCRLRRRQPWCNPSAQCTGPLYEQNSYVTGKRLTCSSLRRCSHKVWDRA